MDEGEVTDVTKIVFDGTTPAKLFRNRSTVRVKNDKIIWRHNLPGHQHTMTVTIE